MNVTTIGKPLYHLEDLMNGEVFVFNTSPTKIFVMMDEEYGKVLDLETGKIDKYKPDVSVYKVKVKQITVEY